MISTLPSNIPPNMINAIQTTMTDRIKMRIRQNKITPPTGKQGGRPTLVESSQLLSSIKGRNNGLRITVGSNKKYARIQHEGGTIVAKNKPYLVFPYRRNGKIMWASVKSVTLPPRPYLFLDNADKTIIAGRIRQWFQSTK